MTQETEDKILDKLHEIDKKVTYTNGKVARAIKDIEDNKSEIRSVQKQSDLKHEAQRSVTDGIKNKMYMAMGAIGVISLFSEKIITLISG